MQLKIDILQSPAARMAGPCERQVFGFEHDISGLRYVAATSGFNVTTDHQVSDRTRRRIGSIDRLHKLAIAQHGDAIGQTKHFIHLVRDIQNRDAAFSQLIDDTVQPLHFGFSQRAGRFGP